MTHKIWCALTAAALALVVAEAKAADAVADFYRGKTVEILIGAAAGGAYDIHGRLIARYLGKHIPGNPAIVVQNMAGAASLGMTNQLYNVSPKDGTVIGMPNNGIPIEPKLHAVDPDGKNTKFDVEAFNWIGSPAQETQVAFYWKDSGVRTVDDLKAKPLTMASNAPGSDTYTLPTLINRLIGTKFKIVNGYPGVADIYVALERREADGSTGGLVNLLVSKDAWLKDGTLRVPLQLGFERHPLLKDAPTLLELVKSDEDKKLLEAYLTKYKLARPLALPPGVPADRVAAIRAAFEATMKDPEYLAEAEKGRIEISPVNGATAQAMVKQIQATPQPIIDRLREMTQ
jgi:tripartite-type tricarboxylate transporter receptor subunit TctC